MHPNMHTLCSSELSVEEISINKSKSLEKESLAGIGQVFSTYLNFDLHNLYLPNYLEKEVRENQKGLCQKARDFSCFPIY